MIRFLAGKNLSRILISLSALTLVPVAFLNFDTHHDGLIVQTVINLKSAILDGGSWPFNQYGSFWIFIFTWGTWPLPEDSILIGIRVITILAYWLTGFLLLKTAREFMSESSSRWVLIYFFLSQPFFGGWNSSFLPWPSALAMPILLGATLIVIRKLNSVGDKRSFSKVDGVHLALSGSLFAMLYGTRLQIGILGTIVAVIFLHFSLGIRASAIFVFGNFLSTIVWALFLLSNNWFKESVVDSIQLASTFLSGNQMVYPRPIATIALSVFLFLLVILFLKLSNDSLRKLLFIGIPLLVPVAVIGIDKLRDVQNGQNNIPNYLALLHRKFMAGFLFASLLLVITFVTIRLFSNLRNSRSSLNTKWLFLLSMSLVAAFQAWPFFDQMHIWWSSVPGVILIIQVAYKLYKKFNFHESVATITAIVILLVMLIPLGAQFSVERKELLSFKQDNVYGISIYEEQNLELTKYFQASMPRGSKVLNLCPNADPFFVDLSYIQVSRFPVYWMSFSKFSNVQNNFVENDPDFIVTCKNLYYSADATAQYRDMQKNVISKHKSDFEIISQYSRNDFDWEIYGKR
jgi:hypothetical protein